MEGALREHAEMPDAAATIRLLNHGATCLWYVQVRRVHRPDVPPEKRAVRPVAVKRGVGGHVVATATEADAAQLCVYKIY